MTNDQTTAANSEETAETNVDPDRPQAFGINEDTATPSGRPRFDEKREEVMERLADGEELTVDDLAGIADEDGDEHD